MTASSRISVERSFSGRRWNVREPNEAAVRTLSQHTQMSDTLARLLAARGVGTTEIADILEPTLKRLLPEPLTLKDMYKAVQRAKAALDRNEKIAVFGDYDVDGSCSSALLASFLASIGRSCRIYVPDRLTEGYGPSARALKLLQDEGASLVITVDCGAGAVEALAAARDSGLDVIVLDHHRADRPLSAFAHVNANQSEDQSGLGHLCAAAVTFLFVIALNRALREADWYAKNGLAEPDLRREVDLVGLATVCDVVPLLGVNRAFVRGALPRLKDRPGLAALAGIAGIEPPFTPHHLGFVFGPRINAGGRVGRCSLGAELLTCKSLAEAEPLAHALDVHNRERQAIEAIILEEALEQAAGSASTSFVFVAGEGWHPGVVGIVAGRLKERFGLPAFVAGLEGGLGRGSVRSIAGIDVGAAVRAARDKGVIDMGGGHAMAAGFSLTGSQVEPFRAFLESWFAEHADAAVEAAALDLELSVALSGATDGLVREIARIGPFGPGNPEPLCAIFAADLAFADVVGHNHVRVKLASPEGARLDGIAFRAADTPWGRALLKARGERVHVAGYLRSDVWNGRTRVQLQLEDAGPATS